MIRAGQLDGAARSDAGRATGLDDLIPVAYDDLRALARELLRRHHSHRVPEATSLVHEAFARMAHGRSSPFENRAQFLRTAARAMRYVLVDQLRRRTAKKRGGQAAPEPLGDQAIAIRRPDSEVLAVDEALGRLAEIDEKKAALVELRFFGGLTLEEVAEALEVSLATAKRDWTLARAWLYRELAPGE